VWEQKLIPGCDNTAREKHADAAGERVTFMYVQGPGFLAGNADASMRRWKSIYLVARRTVNDKGGWMP
jgi:hypothetical protein